MRDLRLGTVLISGGTRTTHSHKLRSRTLRNDRYIKHRLHELGETNCHFVGGTNMLNIGKARTESETRKRRRLEAQLPPISVGAELRKLYQLNRQNDFEEFFRTSPIRERLEEKLLARIRRLRGEPDWRPTGFLSGGGFAFYTHTRKIMRKIWHMQRRNRRTDALTG